MRIMFIIFIVLIQLIIFGAHFLVYRGLVEIFNIQNVHLLFWLKLTLGILSVSFICASILGSNIYTPITNGLYYVAAIWLGLLLYLCIASILFLSIAYGIGMPNTIPALRILGYMLILAGLGVGIYGMFHARNIQITEVRTTLSNIPIQWKGKTLVWVSDIHLGQIYTNSFSKKIALMVQSLNPDIVILGGDIFDGAKSNLETSVAPLGTIRSTYGTYFITGNHEEFSSSDAFINAIQANGMNALKNESKIIDGINFIGVDYRNSEHRDQFEQTLQKLIHPETPTILLKHAPTNLDIAEHAKISFQISGHTHKAQVFPFNYITRMVYGPFEYGLNQYEDMSVYTSSGIGTWGPPLRVGTKSEIVKIVFE